MVQVSKNKDHPLISKILVAVDGSETSSKAAKNAIDLAERYRADLIALYIVPPNIKSSEIFDLAKENGQKIVDEVKHEASAKKLIVQTEVLLDIGSVTKGIVEYAEKNNVNLIVLGTRGISGIKRMLLGSTASGVVTYSHCPVIVVK
ncbi:MAG: universal stress protein [Nitrososphaeraceae archaeon]